MFKVASTRRPFGSHVSSDLLLLEDAQSTQINKNCICFKNMSEIKYCMANIHHIQTIFWGIHFFEDCEVLFIFLLFPGLTLAISQVANG
jgi:hypothetical protein